jgi:heterodisulfide reductase subunit A
MTRGAIVIGGGIAGMQAAINIANQGVHVTVVEKSPSIGGNMPRLDKTFPTMDCSMCILAPRMLEVARHPMVTIMTNAEVKRVSGEAGNFTVEVLQKARMVRDDCTACGDCTKACPVAAPNEFDLGLSTRKAIYQPFPQAVPQAYVIDKDLCLNKGHLIACERCSEACSAKSVDFSMTDETVRLDVGAIVVATGATTFDPTALEEFGYRKYPNVVTTMELERLINAAGPTRGRLVRMSDMEEPKRVAFINCVGSRDHKSGQEYCSKVCCMYGMKDALLVKEHDPSTEVTIFYIDIRAPGKGYEEFYRRIRYEDKVAEFIRGRPADIAENDDGSLTVTYEDTNEGKIKAKTFDMVVLNVALVPRDDTGELARMLGLETDKWGFLKAPRASGGPLDSTGGGLYLAGMVAGPMDITDSTYRGIGAAARAAGETEGERSFPEPPIYPALSTDEIRTGIFICHCGKNIASVVDIKELLEYSKELPGVVHVEENMFSCSEEGQRNMVKNIREKGLTRVVVAACTPRTHEATFQEALREAGLNPFLLDMANIRNQCSWVHPDGTAALSKAKDLVMMSAARAANLSALDVTTVGVVPRAVVIGGGIAGLSAAREFVSNGFETHLIERRPYVGGNVAKFSSVYPQEISGGELISEITRELSESDKFHLHTSTAIDDVGGYVGNFTLTATSNEFVSDRCNLCGECAKVCPVKVPDEFEERLFYRRAVYRKDTYPPRYYIDAEACTKCGECVKVCKPGAIDLSSKDIELEFGAIVVATGFEAGDREALKRWGHRKSKAVLTTAELERLISKTGPTRGKLDSFVADPKNIAVLLCADMRWGRNGYCSRFCCASGLKSARELKLRYPNANVYVLYESMRTTWTQELLYEEVQGLGVRFVAYSFDDMPKIMTGEKPRLVVKDPLMRSTLDLTLDLLVLSVGGVPSRGSEELTRALRISSSPEGFIQEAHVKLAPVDATNSGIFIAGAAQFPRDVGDSVAQGCAAAARGMAIISREFIEVGGVVAHVLPEKCSSCMTCLRTCPYDAIFIDREGLAEVNMAKCRGCGICTAECPAKAIVLRSYEDDQIIPMVDALIGGATNGG